MTFTGSVCVCVCVHWQITSSNELSPFWSRVPGIAPTIQRILMLRFPNRSALHELLDSALSDHICAHTHTLTVAKHTNSFICLANLEYSCEYYNNNNAQRTECNNGQRAKDEFGAPAAATTNITFKQTFWAGPIGKSG